MNGYSDDPTAKGDEVARQMRDYYEANKPRWWQRPYNYETADDLMIGLLNIVLLAYPQAASK